MPPMDEQEVRALENLTIARYSDRLHCLGRDPRTLGWDSVSHQRQRFACARRVADFSGRAVLDIGCGFGDLLVYLMEQQAAPSSYTGIDINEELLKVAAEAHPTARFEYRNILTNPIPSPSADVVSLFGVLNWRLPVGNNLDHAESMIARGWAATRDILVVDMLSDRLDPSYPREDFVFYYAPERMLAYSLSLTPHVTLLHDYASLPQREFMLVLRRRPCA